MSIFYSGIWNGTLDCHLKPENKVKKYFIIFLFSLTGVSAQEIVCDDCSGYFEKEKTQLTFFKDKNIKEKQKLTGLRKAIFKHIPEVFLTGENMFVSIYVHPFINDNITVQCSSGSTLNHDKILFLDQLFWSEKTFEYVAKKLKKNIIPTIGSVSSRQTITKDFINRLKPEGYYQFMLKLPEFKDHNNRMAVYYPKNQ